MKKTIIIFSSALLMIACGSSGDKSAKTDSASSGSNTATVSAANEKGLELIGASDCTTCHKLDKNSTSGIAIGPAYSDVAAKYAPAADTTIDRLVKKVISGGSGVWGTTPMTAHAMLKEDDVRTMVKYILSLKK
ncbi:MAG TPA: c-type cytochrome [Puia sp.]|jgi:cytochrome c|nr:c-type cytochrome [Puia sp.]